MDISERDIPLPSSWEDNRAPIMELVNELNPRSILDIGVGAGHYGPLLREAFPDARIDGYEVCPEIENELWEAYDEVYIGNILEDAPCGYDLYLMVDVVEHWLKEQALAFLAALDGHQVISTPIDYPQGPDEFLPWQEHVSQWERGDFVGYDDYSNYKSFIMVKRSDDEV